MERIILLYGVITLLFVFDLKGQTALQKAVISGGGGAVASPNFNINLSLSQTAVGHAKSQEKKAQMGFWFLTPESEQEMSTAFHLSEGNSGPTSQTFPNPFRERITFYLRLTQREKVQIVIYSLDGKMIVEICDEWMGAGIATKEWYPKGLSEGQYVAKLSTSNGYSKISPIILVR